MSDKIQKIKQEIERIIEEETPISKGSDYYHGAKESMEKLLKFIDSLPEEHNEDLEEAAYHFCMDEFGNPKESLFEFDQRCFITGAEWQKQRDKLTWVDMNQITACYEITKEKFGTDNYTDKEWGEDILKQYKEAKED